MKNPIIVCASEQAFSEYGLFLKKFWQCNANLDTAAFHPAEASTIILCPNFFRLAIIPTMPFKCPRWNVENQRLVFPYDAQTVDFQSYILARALVDTIIGKSNNIVVAPSENLPDWNELINRTFREKLQNAGFHQPFLACMYSFELLVVGSKVADSFLLLVLNHGCELPTTSRSRSLGRGTLFWTSYINSTRIVRMVATSIAVSSI